MNAEVVVTHGFLAEKIYHPTAPNVKAKKFDHMGQE
jgi:hypothetical protein